MQKPNRKEGRRIALDRPRTLLNEPPPALAVATALGRCCVSRSPLRYRSSPYWLLRSMLLPSLVASLVIAPALDASPTLNPRSMPPPSLVPALDAMPARHRAHHTPSSSNRPLPNLHPTPTKSHFTAVNCIASTVIADAVDVML